MKHQGLIVGATVAALSLSLSACDTLKFGQMKGQTTTTRVELSKNNYKVIKTGAKGASTHGFKLFGMIPFGGPDYAEAKEKLYSSVGQPLTGKAIGLANQTEEWSERSYVLLSIPTVTLQADVIEFTDSNAK